MIYAAMVKSTSFVIRNNEVKGIARRFLEQHNSVHYVEEPILEDGIWTVTVLISSFGNQLRKVRIDAKNGKIIDWY